MSVLGPPTGYVDILDHLTTEKLMKDKAEGKEFQKSPIRPSSAGACTRELYFSLQQYTGQAKYDTELITPETSRIFGLGHTIEYHLIKEMGLMAGLFDIRFKQQVLSFGFLKAEDPKLAQWFEGSIDLVFWSAKHKCVADVKSKKDKFSAFYKTNWDETTEKLRGMRSVKSITEKAFWVEDLEAFLVELNDPFFAANFLQLNLYANSDFLVERGIDHGFIVQYNKNDSRLREIRFKPSRALYDRTIQRMQNVITAVETKNPELAPREFALGSFKCAFCKYKSECWEGADAKKEFFNTLPKKSWPKDTGRMGEVGQGLEKLFTLFSEQSQAEKQREVTEAAILKLMLDQKVHKLRLENGDVYEAKKLKDGMVIRRSKV